jgi:predicted phosphohydrolase
MKLAWATDIHLNFCGPRRARKFIRKLAGTGADAILLGGDIAEASDLEDWLGAIESAISVPAYFVLGNHDYYGAEVAAVEDRMQRRVSRGLTWLPAAGVVPLSPRTALVGSGGWGDARNGDFLGSDLVLSDFTLILDLQRSSGVDDPLAVLENRAKLQRKLMELGDRAADELRPALVEAARAFEHVVVLTHVPPFPEMSWHRGHPADSRGLPSFSCRALGDLILEVAEAHPRCRLTILSGHTHDEATAQVRPNLLGHTQRAIYGSPAFRILDVDEAVHLC